jgi:hypothetical protein
MTRRNLFGASLWIDGDPNGIDCVEVELSAEVSADEVADLAAWVEVGGKLVEVPLTDSEWCRAFSAVSKAYHASMRD